MLDSKEKKSTSSDSFSDTSSGIFADALDAVLNNVKSPTGESHSAVDVDKINRLILDIPEAKIVSKSIEQQSGSTNSLRAENDLTDFGNEDDLLTLEKEGVTILEVDSSEYDASKVSEKVETSIPMDDFDLTYEKKIDAAELNDELSTEDALDDSGFQLYQTTEGLERAKVSIDEINDKIVLLSTDNEHLKQQVVSLKSPINQCIDATEKIDELKKEQGRVRKSLLDNEENKPASPAFALGTALLSLLLAGGLGIIGYGVQSDISELSGLVSTLEKEIDHLKVESPSANISKIDDKINLLIENDNHLNKQLNDVTRVLQSNSIKTVIYGLVEQNTQTNNTIEQLMAKVETLEKSGASSVGVTPVTKAIKSKLPTVKGQKKSQPLVSKKQNVSVEKKAVITHAPKEKKVATLVVPALVTPKKIQNSVPEKNKNSIVKGRWVVNLASFNRMADAEKKLSVFNKKGISAEIIRAKVNGSNWFRIRSTGFKTKRQATSFSVQAKNKLKLSSTWITKI